jgi:hypothetical protein
MAYQINTTRIFDNNNVPMFSRVYYSDVLGRPIEAWEGFKSRTAATVFWWMLARKQVKAWLPCGLDGWLPNNGTEPAEMKARIDACEKQYDSEGQTCSEGAEWARMLWTL